MSITKITLNSNHSSYDATTKQVLTFVASQGLGGCDLIFVGKIDVVKSVTAIGVRDGDT